MTLCKVEIVLGRRSVVLAVKGLDGRQARIDHAGNQVIALQQAGMRERCDAACTADDADDIGGTELHDVK